MPRAGLPKKGVSRTTIEISPVPPACPARRGVLAFRQQGRELFHAMREQVTLPLLTSSTSFVKPDEADPLGRDRGVLPVDVRCAGAGQSDA